MNNILERLVVGAPNIDGFFNFFQGQVGKVVLICGIVGLVIAAAKFSFKLAITVLLVGGLIYFAVTEPETVFGAIADLWKMVMG